ncbi:MAG: DUF4830 domain-containing protein [Ruminococcaceae bacterium]|nr:DUF4830 domain-containing protein [Oscillospiraceae bacterium]
MSRKGKLGIKQIALFVIIVLVLVFLVNFTVNYVKGCFGSVSAEDAASFLKGYGWELDLKDCVQDEIVIPKDFSEVYERYNALQLKQGYDLTKYRTDTVIRYTFKVRNFEGYENALAHVLTKGGKIIGGDICSTDLSGIMTGFDGKTS